jgi:hypothetical protein
LPDTQNTSSYRQESGQDFQYVIQHPILKKWLYLPEASEGFETVSSDIVEAIRIGDQRFGVEPKERKSRKKS